MDVLSRPDAQAALWLVALVGIVTLAVHYVRKWRDGDEGDTPAASELLANFRELCAQGVLSPEEYRTIKAKLAERLTDELSDSSKQV